MESIENLREYSKYNEVLSELADAIEQELAERYLELPLDADGVPIRVGDVMAYEDNTKPTKVVALVPPAVFLTDEGPRYADMCRHYQPDTWERIIEDAAQFGHDSDVYNIDMEKFVARCKALAGEVSE